MNHHVDVQLHTVQLFKFVAGPTTDVPVIIQIDNVALEPDEDFTLSFEVANQDPDNLLTGVGMVIVNELQVFIEDQTGECVLSVVSVDLIPP